MKELMYGRDLQEMRYTKGNRCITVPAEWRDILTTPLAEALEEPSGRWKDFNCLHRSWRLMRDYIRNGNAYMICPGELPEEPDPNDFADNLTSPKITGLCG